MGDDHLNLAGKALCFVFIAYSVILHEIAHGYAALKFGDLFTPQTAFWSVAGSVVQPIFHGGTLAQRELAARATYDQTNAQYRSTVISAFQNVADVLSELNRVAPGQGGPLSGDDYKSILGEVKGFLIDEQRGFLRFLNIVKARGAN